MIRFPVIRLLAPGFLCIMTFASAAEVEPVQAVPGSIMDTMLTVIAPAADVLWAVDNPESSADWEKLDRAAQVIIDIAGEIKTRASGVNAEAWAGQAIWSEHTEQRAEAGRQARRAIPAQEPDALYDAGDARYQPCEACQQEFNPGVIQ